MKKKNIILLLILVFMFAPIIVVKGESIDLNRKGSLNISLMEEDSNVYISGAEITVYKVADAIINGYNLSFTSTNDVSACEIDFSDIENINLNGNTISCIMEKGAISGVKTTSSNGNVIFNNLDLGMYLVVQSKKVGNYANFDSFLISLPQTINNAWEYSIKAEPKVEKIKIANLTVTKKWNNEGKVIPNSVDIELLNNERVIETVTLSADNNWTYTWQDLEYSDKYSVREINIPDNYVATYSNDGYEYIVTNTIKLPQTGLELWKVQIITFIGLGSLAFGLLLNSKSNEENN